MLIGNSVPTTNSATSAMIATHSGPMSTSETCVAQPMTQGEMCVTRQVGGPP